MFFFCPENCYFQLYLLFLGDTKKSKKGVEKGGVVV